MLENNHQQNNNGGVKTEEGKAISRYNAQKHMILRETLTEYEQADVTIIFDELCGDLQPKGRMQEMIIEIIANNAIKLARIDKAESEVIKEAMSPSTGWLEGLDEGRQYSPSVNYQAVEKLNLCSRYQTATENRIYRALSVFKQLKSYEQS